MKPKIADLERRTKLVARAGIDPGRADEQRALLLLARAARRIECPEHITFNPETKKCEPLPEDYERCPECDVVAACDAFDWED